MTSEPLDGLLGRIEEHRAVLDARLAGPARWRGPLRTSDDPERTRRVAAAFDGLVHRFERGDRAPLTADDLLELQRVAEGDGAFRETTARVGGHVMRHDPARLAEHVTRALDRAFDGVEPPALAAARLHLELLLIHPFRDGNGRTARLAASWILIRSGYRSTLLTAVEQHPRRHRSEYGRSFRLLTTHGLDVQGPWLRMALRHMLDAGAHAAAFRRREDEMRVVLRSAGVPERRHDRLLAAHDLDGGDVENLRSFPRLGEWLADRPPDARMQIGRLLQEEAAGG